MTSFLFLLAGLTCSQSPPASSPAADAVTTSQENQWVSAQVGHATLFEQDEQTAAVSDSAGFAAADASGGTAIVTPTITPAVSWTSAEDGSTPAIQPTAFESAVGGTSNASSPFSLPPYLFPDRSRPTPRIETVPTGHWMTEAGFFSAGTSLDLTWAGREYEPELNLSQYSLLARRGLTDALEARFYITGGAGEFIVPTLYESEEPLFTLGGGIKARLVDGEGWRPDVSLLGTLGFGRNDNFEDPNEVLWDVLGIFRWNPREDTSLGFSAGAGNRSVVDEYAGTGTFSLFAERFWSDQFSTFTDLFFNGGTSQWSFGFVARIRERMFVDLSGGIYSVNIEGAEQWFGADDDLSTGGFVSAGLSYLW